MPTEFDRRTRAVAERYDVDPGLRRKLREHLDGLQFEMHATGYAAGWVNSQVLLMAEAHAGCQVDQCQVCEGLASMLAMMLELHQVSAERDFQEIVGEMP